MEELKEEDLKLGIKIEKVIETYKRARELTLKYGVPIIFLDEFRKDQNG